MNIQDRADVHSDVSFTFQAPEHIEFGRGTTAEAGSYARSYGDSALHVTDPQLVQLGVIDPVVASLEDVGMNIEIFDGVEPDPTLSVIREAIAVAREADADVLVGGGSSMDVAKGTAVILANPELEAEPFGRGHVPEPGMPTILLPTTAGSGAEVSPAVVDPTLSETLQPEITRATGSTPSPTRSAP